MRLFSTKLLLIITLGLVSDNFAAQVPDFTLNGLEGESFNIHTTLQNGPLLISFWSTLCKACVKELPYIEEMHQRYSKEGLQVIAVSVDNPKGASKIRPFTRSAGFSFPVLLDPNMEFRKQFGGDSTPFNVLVNSKGEIVYSHIGYVPGDEKVLEQHIKSLFTQQPE